MRILGLAGRVWITGLTKGDQGKRVWLYLWLLSAQDGAGLVYPAYHPAQDGMERMILWDKIIEHLSYIYFETTRSAYTRSPSYALRVPENKIFSERVKELFFWSSLTCYNKCRSWMPHPLNHYWCFWWRNHASRGFSDVVATKLKRLITARINIEVVMSQYVVTSWSIVLAETLSYVIAPNRSERLVES